MILLGISLGMMCLSDAQSLAMRTRVLSSMKPMLAWVHNLPNHIRPTAAAQSALDPGQAIDENLDDAELRMRNERMNAEIARLRNEIRTLKANQQEQSGDENRTLNGVKAQLIQRRMVWDEPLLGLDKGSLAGVCKHAGVLHNGAACGRITEVANQASTMAWLTNPKMRTAVRLLKCGTPGMLKGLGDSTGLCRMSVVAQDLQTQTGDGVVTSGLDGSFPPGCLVGQVVAVEDKGNRNWDVDVKPVFRSDAVEVLFVVAGESREIPWSDQIARAEDERR